VCVFASTSTELHEAKLFLSAGIEGRSPLRTVRTTFDPTMSPPRTWLTMSSSFATRPSTAI